MLPLQDQAENQDNVLRPKKLKVSLVSRDQMPVQTLELRVLPREQFCDQVFRFYEPQNTKVYLRLPKGFIPFFTLTKGMQVRTSNPQTFESGIDYESGEVYLMTKTHERPPKHLSTYVFLYSDPYFSTLLACCQVQVYSLQA